MNDAFFGRSVYLGIYRYQTFGRRFFLKSRHHLLISGPDFTVYQSSSFIRSLLSNCACSLRHIRHIISHMKNLLKARQETVLTAAVVIMVTYGLSFILGLFKTWLLVRYFFNQSQILDAFYAASIIPDAVFQLIVAGSLSAAFIPVFSKSLLVDEKKAWEMAAIVVNLVMSLLLVLTVVIFVSAPFFSRLVSPGFSFPQTQIQSQLLRLMLISQLFFAVSGFLTASLQTHRHFLLPALSPVVYNFAIILGILVFSPAFGIFGPALGMVIGSFLHMAIQYPLAHRLGFRFAFRFDFRLPEIKEIIHLFPPRIITIAVDQIEQFSATIISSFLVSGSLTLFNLAKTLSYLPVTLFGVSLGQASLPTLSGYSNTQKYAKFQKSLTESLLQIAFLVVPLSVLFIVLRVQLVRLAFGAPSLPWKATIITGQTLAILAISAVFSAAIQLLIRSFYALHDTKTPLYTGLAAAMLNILISYIFGLHLHHGITGIAFGWSLAAVFESIVLTVFLFRRLKISVTPLIPQISKILIAGFSTALALWLPMRLLDMFVFDTTRTLSLLFLTAISGTIGFIVYLAMSYFFRVEELFSFLSLFRRLKPKF